MRWWLLLRFIADILDTPTPSIYREFEAESLYPRGTFFCKTFHPRRTSRKLKTDVAFLISVEEILKTKRLNCNFINVISYPKFLIKFQSNRTIFHSRRVVLPNVHPHRRLLLRRLRRLLPKLDKPRVGHQQGNRRSQFSGR